MPIPVRLLIFLCCLAVVPQSLAQRGDVPGSSDPAMVDRFPGSRIVDYQHLADTSYNLVLGRMQRVNGRVTPGASERLRGTLSRITYSIPSGFAAEEVYNYFGRQLLQDAAPALFSCQGRDCGSSNFWANDVFSNRILYGPEASQYYLVANPDSGEDSNTYVAVYVVTRANRSVYAHLDVLELPAGEAPSLNTTPEALLQRLRREQSVVLAGFGFDSQDQLEDSSGIELAANVLRREPLINVYIVAHLRGSGELEALVERSGERARQVRQALIEAGINGNRIIARGVGPLAPVCNGGSCEQRIEMVLQ